MGQQVGDPQSFVEKSFVALVIGESLQGAVDQLELCDQPAVVS